MSKRLRLVVYLLIFITTKDVCMSYIAIYSATFHTSPFCLTEFCGKKDARKVGSRIDCAMNCRKSEMCSGFLYPHTGNCTLLGPDCFSSPRCSSNNPNLYQKQLSPEDCQHHSALRESQMACNCVGGWVGLLCQRQPYSCNELYAYGYPYGHLRTNIDVYRNRSLVVSTVCYGRPRFTTTYILSNRGNKNMDESWDHYVEGFQTDDWNFWIGLKGLLALNEMGLSNIIFGLHLAKLDGKNGYHNPKVQCSNFIVKDGNHGYAITSDPCYMGASKATIMNISYELEDVISMSSGLPFLTPDHDNGQSCAGKASRGWWFPDCSSGLKVNPLAYKPMADLQPEMIFPGINTGDQEIRRRLASVDMSYVVFH